MSEEMLIRYCAPTLAGIKTASLFTCPSDSKEELREQIRSANRQLLPRGIRLLPLRQQSGHALIYMYRPKRLERDLASQKAEAILARAHYPAGDPQRPESGGDSCQSTLPGRGSAAAACRAVAAPASIP